jgi:N-acetylglucosaminyl-diphospho-decaprenol L-rhamnosyltransferase
MVLEPTLLGESQVSGNVWIIIVNFRTPDLVVDCLHSIAAHRAEIAQLHTVIVDNASGDGSAQQIANAIRRANWRDWASVMPLANNGGFAYGNNAGISLALQSDAPPDYLLLLNPDTVLRSGAIQALVQCLEDNRAAGIVGSRLEDREGNLACSAHNALSPVGELLSGARLGLLDRLFADHRVSPPIRNDAHECDWVSGASMMIRKQVISEIGLLDDEYFLYFEEADYCLRAQKRGWQIWFCPASHVIHFEGSATGIRDTAKRRPNYWYASRRRYFIKHFGVTGLISADLLWLVGRLSLQLRQFLQRKPNVQPEPKWHTFDLLYGDFISLLRK